MVPIALIAAWQRKRLARILSKAKPRIAIVKQDTQDDLYSCPLNSGPAEVVASSLMRSGPAGLFAVFKVDFIIVCCSDEPECSIWKEKALELGWYSLSNLENLKEKIPYLSKGQGEYSVAVDSVNWKDFDIVISIDIAVPKRIVEATPKTLWCYYVREPKTSSYSRSLQAPLGGYDIFLTQRFGLKQNYRLSPHCIDLPYYLQYIDWMSDVFGDSGSTEKSGCFLEHSTATNISMEQLDFLKSFGPVYSTAFSPPSEGMNFYDRSVMTTRDRITKLQAARYFIQFGDGGRSIFGNGYIEAVCAGCVAIGNPNIHTHRDVFDETTTAGTWKELKERLKALEANPRRLLSVRKRQAQVIQYTCWTRPLSQLLVQWHQKTMRS